MHPHQWQTYVAVAGSLAAIVAGSTYVRSIIAGETKPLRVTWGSWTLIGVLGLISSFQAGAGIGLIAVLPFVVFVAIAFLLSLSPKYGKPGANWLDYLTGGVAAIVLLTQLIIKYSPAVGASVAVIGDLIFLWPTIREAWRQPDLESLYPWIIGAVAETLSLISLENYSYASAAYPVYVLLGNLAVITALVLQRPRPKKASRRPRPN